MPRKPARTKQPRPLRPNDPITAAEFNAAIKAAGVKDTKFTPTQLLAFVLKLVLKDRITDKESKLISETYIWLVKEWWTKPRLKKARQQRKLHS